MTYFLLNLTNECVKFIIELTSIWKWLGYSRKMIVKKHFVIEKDYKINFTVNFKELVKNSDISLNLNYQSKMIDLLNNEFTEQQQQWYIANLYMYLNYDFPINLENVFKMIGFANKGNAMKTIKSNFIVNEDYKTSLLPKEKSSWGGSGSEQIMLNIDTFKNLCMIAKTPQGKDIRKYYVKLENIHNKIIKEEIEQQKILLENTQEELKNTQKELENNLNTQDDKRHLFLLEKFKNKKCVYIAHVSKNNKNILKIGSTYNIDERKGNLKDVFGFCRFVNVFETEKYREVEKSILIELRKQNVNYTEKLNNHQSKELVEITNLFTYNHLLQIIKKIIDHFRWLSPEEFYNYKKLELVEKFLDKGFNC